MSLFIFLETVKSNAVSLTGIILIVVLLLYRQLLYSTFNEEQAKVSGIPVEKIIRQFYRLRVIEAEALLMSYGLGEQRMSSMDEMMAALADRAGDRVKDGFSDGDFRTIRYKGKQKLRNKKGEAVKSLRKDHDNISPQLEAILELLEFTLAKEMERMDLTWGIVPKTRIKQRFNLEITVGSNASTNSVLPLSIKEPMGLNDIFLHASTVVLLTQISVPSILLAPSNLEAVFTASPMAV